MNLTFSCLRLVVFFAILLFSWSVLAQSQASSNQDSPQSQADQSQDPLKRPITPERQKKGKLEKASQYQERWVNEDVKWIITDEELAAWKKLATNAERDSFIETFWQNRNPNPDSPENTYKNEHYRRLAYANDHFASGVPGWRTDRGRIYIMYGKPDSIDAHPAGGPYQRPQEEGGGQTETYPFETWTYRHLPGIGQEIQIEFVDQCNCGEYRMTNNRSDKDASLYIPNAGPTELESMNLATKRQRFSNPESLGPSFFNQGLQSKEFDRLETYAKLQGSPQMQFNDVNESVTSIIRYNLLPFDLQTDFVKLDSKTVLVPVCIQVPNREVTFVNKDGVQRGVLNIFGKVITLTGRVAQTFEEPVRLDIPSELLDKYVDHVALYWHASPLPPGHYRLDVVVKDVNGDKMGVVDRNLIVPEYGSDKLAASSLILSDVMEPVASQDVGGGSFVIGTTKVRPRVASQDGKPAAFKRSSDPKVNFWMQVYNLAMDEQTQKPSATVEYQVVNTATNEPVMKLLESTNEMGNVKDQLTLKKSLAVGKLEPGIYRVTISIHDLVSRQTISPSAEFVIE